MKPDYAKSFLIFILLSASLICGCHSQSPTALSGDPHQATIIEFSVNQSSYSRNNVSITARMGDTVHVTIILADEDKYGSYGFTFSDQTGHGAAYGLGDRADTLRFIWTCPIDTLVQYDGDESFKPGIIVNQVLWFKDTREFQTKFEIEYRITN